MKFTALLLAFATLVLSLSPCCVEENACVEKAEIECSEHHDEKKSNKERHSCSPFYACGTCIGFTSGSIAFEFIVVPHKENLQNSFYAFFTSKGFDFQPLKPPRRI